MSGDERKKPPRTIIDRISSDFMFIGLLLVGLGGLIVVAVPAAVYYFNTGPFGSPTEPGQSLQATMGQFGDFMGGSVNPILGFLSLIALLLTVALQARQLELTRQELQEARADQAAARVQAETLAKLQRETAMATQEHAKYAKLSARATCFNNALELSQATIEFLDIRMNAVTSQKRAKYQNMRQKAKDREERLSTAILKLADELLEQDPEPSEPPVDEELVAE